VLPKICKCNLCLANEYDNNMSLQGPEQMNKVKMTISDILKLIGQNSSKNLEIVDKLCSWSIASFDIESRTVATDMEPPCHFQQNHIEINGSNIPRYVKKVQKPCMVAHWDALCESFFKSLHFYLQLIATVNKAFTTCLSSTGVK